MTIGLLLAAGSGSRMGRPKALVTGNDGVAWVVSSARTLAAGGCTQTYVVVGAAASQVRSLLSDEPVTIVEATDWQSGMGSSLRAGLDAIVTATATAEADATLIHLVDLPDVGAEVVARLISHAEPNVLARADYGNEPGHPVLVGREHWEPIATTVSGDRGAGSYLRRHHVIEVDCSDLAGGQDIDRPRHMLGP